MYLHRTLDNTLLEWKNSEKRKPLLLRGARQVGKTDSVRNLGAKFEYFIELNFEIDDRAAPIFEGSLYPD
ncbi:MAG: ATP-binding protein, partial [Spirochaetes bacterium]|nr:ATP-binding protein [Spirochaetota bacterium]